MSDICHRLIMLKPMQNGLSGYARVQSGGGETLLQINARGVREDSIRAFWYCGDGEVRELGRARVNPRGEASLTAEVPGQRVAPERLQALLIVGGGDEPVPLMLGLCVQQSAGSLLDAKNALLGLCEKLSRAARERRKAEQREAARQARGETDESKAETQASVPPPQMDAPVPEGSQAGREASAPVREPAAALSDGRDKAQPEPPARLAEPSSYPPREIFLPAIDPLPYVVAKEAEEPDMPGEEEPGQQPPPGERCPEVHAPVRRNGPAVDRLRPLCWPQAFAQLKPYFDSCLPCAVFSLPGWRFVRLAGRQDSSAQDGSLWIGYSQIDGKVCRVAYALRGDRPPDDGKPYRARRGRDGRLYQVLWQKV